ncbi:unnamed protein product [Phytophthora lilii]|uniref:Unnamed protein product n=1 Tax=Phytophthora lilii TaxID=2077276 RepID=A0A9W6TL56_9STRA|nr:unnamed protein product [Phytophthora lilii]
MTMYEAEIKRTKRKTIHDDELGEGDIIYNYDVDLADDIVSFDAADKERPRHSAAPATDQVSALANAPAPTIPVQTATGPAPAVSTNLTPTTPAPADGAPVASATTPVDAATPAPAASEPVAAETGGEAN